MPKNQYAQWLENSQREWESRCVRCGACCGAFEDPCEHLHKDKDGLYYCDTYKNRLGPKKSVAGKDFDCVPLRQKLNTSWPGDENCAYKRVRK